MNGRIHIGARAIYYDGAICYGDVYTMIGIFIILQLYITKGVYTVMKLNLISIYHEGIIYEECSV